MYSSHKGSGSMGIAIAVAVVVIAGIALFWYTGAFAPQDDAIMMSEEDSMMEKDDAMTEDDHMMEGEDAMMKEDDAMMKAEGDVMMEDGDAMMESKTETSFKSAVIAGSSAPLLEFDQRDYEAALASDKLVVLYFYASWCPICRAEFEHTKAAFEALGDENVVGFRVHYNDNATTSEMEAVAREYGVAYQHTKVFIKDGERVLKSPEQWDTARYTTEINAALAQ